MVNVLRFAGKKLDFSYTIGSKAIVEESNIDQDNEENNKSREKLLRIASIHDDLEHDNTL